MLKAKSLSFSFKESFLTGLDVLGRPTLPPSELITGRTVVAPAVSNAQIARCFFRSLRASLRELKDMQAKQQDVL